MKPQYEVGQQVFLKTICSNEEGYRITGVHDVGVGIYRYLLYKLQGVEWLVPEALISLVSVVGTGDNGLSSLFKFKIGERVSFKSPPSPEFASTYVVVERHLTDSGNGTLARYKIGGFDGVVYEIELDREPLKRGEYPKTTGRETDAEY